MRIIIALCFLLLVSTSFAKKSKLSEALNSFIALASSDEYDTVSSVIHQIYQEIADDFHRVNQQFEDESAAFQDHVSTLTAYIGTLADEVDGTAEYLRTERALAVEIQGNIDADLEKIIEAQSMYDTEVARRQAYHDDFVAKHDALAEAIEAAKGAFELITEVASEDLAATFIQINNKKINNHLALISKTVFESNLKFHGHVESMMNVLLESMQEGINADVAQQLLELLGHFIDTLEAEFSQLVDDEDADAANSAASLEWYQGIVDAQTADASYQQDELDTLEENIAADEDTLRRYQALRDQAKEALDAVRAEWDEKSNNYSKLLKRLQLDMDALQEAEEFIENNQ